MIDRRLRLLEDLRAVEMFVAVVEAHSITRAAQRLGVRPSTVSKKLAEIEGRARTTLVRRTTRRMTLTDVGHRFYEQCLRILDEAERTEWELRDEARDPGGRIRVTAPVVFAQRQIAPLLPSFLKVHPRIEVELLASARIVNLIEEGKDLSIRLLQAGGVGRTSRVLAPNRRVFCAAPSYLDRFGIPQHPLELAERPCLIAMSSRPTDLWRYKDEGEVKSVRVRGPLTSDNVMIVARAVIDGLGIGMMGSFAIGDALREGSVVEILREYVVQDSLIVAAFPPRGFIPYRVQLFVDHLAKEFGSPPVWDDRLFSA